MTEKAPVEKNIKVKVIFYFKDDADRNARLELARQIISEKGGTQFTEDAQLLKNDVERVTFLFNIDQSVAMLHRGFDSLFNKDYQFGGCGAGEVTLG